MPSKADGVANMISSLFGITYETTDKYEFKIGANSSVSVKPSELSAIADQMSAYQEVDNLAVVTKNSYEVLVQSNRGVGYTRHLLKDALRLEDPHQGLTYEIDAPSLPYLMHILCKAPAGARPVMRRFNLASPARLLERDAINQEINLFELLRMSNALFALRITSDKDKGVSSWPKLAEAAYFHLSYNIDIAFMPFSTIDELARPAAISRVRRSKLSELDAPRRAYIRDLVHHYQLAVSAESPMLEYISHYHVAEHWFESIYQDDLVQNVQEKITSPAFSHKRKQDVQTLIRTISKAVQLRNEEVIINELEALKLTLTKYIDVPQLVDDLNRFNPDLIHKYSSHTVKFSNGDKIPFNTGDDHAIVTALSKRIYKTRNSLVHSKEGSKSRFVPFADDAELLPEVPLMRFIAEQIIIATSTTPS